MLAYIGLGSNLQNPLQQVITASQELRRLPSTHFFQSSSCYLSSPLGPADQPDYVNRVISLQTELEPEILLDKLQAIENQQGRERLCRWGPRTIDLDILLYGQEVIITQRLTVPHPGLKDRSFFLYPLVEIAPHLVLPDGEKVLDLMRKLADHSSIIRLPNSTQETE